MTQTLENKNHKTNTKRIRLLLLRMVLILSVIMTGLGLQVFADAITVTYNGNLIDFKDASPQVVQNRTLVPLRAIFEALGLKVAWDEKTQTVSGINDTTQIKLKIGSTVAEVNQKPVNLDIGAMMIKGRTMVPARFIAESIGAKVEWESHYNNVAITYYQSESDQLKGEIDTLLNKEKILLGELAVEKEKHLAYETKAKAEISRLDKEYSLLRPKLDLIKKQYKGTRYGKDTYYGPIDSQGNRSGIGYYTFYDGSSYLGSYKNDAFSGFGIYTWPNGEYYYGDFANGNFNGSGINMGLDQSKSYSQFKDDYSNGNHYVVFEKDGTTCSDLRGGKEVEIYHYTFPSGTEQYFWESGRFKQSIEYSLYKDGDFRLVEAVNPETNDEFVIESFFVDTHILHYMDTKTEESEGLGLSYVKGENYVYYGEFSNIYYEKAEEYGYYNMNGDFFEFRNKIDAIIAQIITPNMSEREKVTAIHDYVVKNYHYNPIVNDNNDYPAPQHMAYHMVLTKEGICEAYAETMNILLNQVGIDSMVVLGNSGYDANKESWSGHSWNYVKVDNQFYHLDATWDDPVPDQANVAYYDYFLVSDDKISIDHEWSESKEEVEAFKNKNAVTLQ